MSKVPKQNIFNTAFGCLKFAVFVLWILIQLPFLFIFKTGAAGYMKFFMTVAARIAGVRVKMFGTISNARPLMVVSNHISVFEFTTFPVAMGGSFFAKKEMESWPIVGWVSKKFGVIFIDRRASQVKTALAAVQKTMESVKYPMFLFPEGTTTNGSYVKKFKSSLFNFIEGSDITIVPIVMNYRYRDGSVINETDMANHFAYFNNSGVEFGPKCTRERSAFGQVFHVMVLGGFNVEITVLPPCPTVGMDRKEIADTLHKIISDKYMELKDGRKI